MKNMKKLVALFAIVAMLGTLCVPVMAAETYSVDFTQQTAFADGSTSIAVAKGEAKDLFTDLELNRENGYASTDMAVTLDGGLFVPGKGSGAGGDVTVDVNTDVPRLRYKGELPDVYTARAVYEKGSTLNATYFQVMVHNDNQNFYEIITNDNPVYGSSLCTTEKVWIFRKVVDGAVVAESIQTSATDGHGDIFDITMVVDGANISWTVNGESGSYVDPAPFTVAVADTTIDLMACAVKDERGNTYKSFSVTPGAPEAPGEVGSIGTIDGTNYAIDFKNVTSLGLPDGTSGTSYTGVKSTAAEVVVDADWSWVNAGINTGGQGGIAIDAENGGLLLTAAPASGASFNEPTSPKVPRLVYNVADAIPDEFTFNVTINKDSVQNGVIIDFLRHNDGQNYYQLYLVGASIVPAPAEAGGNYPAALLYRVEGGAVTETVVYDAVENPANHTSGQPNYYNRFTGVEDVTVTVKDGKVVVTVEGERNMYGVDAEGNAVNEVVTATLETTNAFTAVSAKDTQVAIGTIRNGDWAMNIPGFTMGAAVADDGGEDPVVPPVDPEQPGEGGEEGGEDPVVPPVDPEQPGEGGETGDNSVMNGSNLTDSGLKITAATATYVLDGEGKKTYDINLTYEGVEAATAQITVLGYVYNTANAGEVPALSGDSAIYAIDQKANSTYGGTVNIKVSEAGARPLSGTTLVVKMGSDDASVTTAQAVLIDLANAKELVAPLVVTAATPAVATVSLGADAAAVAAALPKTVTVTGTREGIEASALANVTWDTTGLNTAVPGDVTLTGTLDASELIDNTAGVTASVTVTVVGLTQGEAVDRGTVDISKDSDAATVASRIGKVTVKSGDVTDTYTVKAENISAVDTSVVGTVTVTVTVSGESDNKKFNLATPVTYTVTLNVVEGPVGILGDANADGYVDAMDAVMVANHAFFGADINDSSMADVNKDGYIDAMDAVAIANYAFFGTEF